jgi:hypothetical protein
VAAVTEADNVARWDGSHGHYEVWYLTFNHRPTRAGFWIRYTLEAPRAGEPEARVWFAFFDGRDPARSFALNRGFPAASLRREAGPFAVAVGDALLRHDVSVGALEGGGHRAEWDLSWTPSSWTHRHLPGFVYRTRFADTRVLSPNPDVRLHGTVVADGRSFELTDEPGGQTHLWGRKHAHSWAWGRCTAFAGGEDAFLEALTVRVRRAGIVLPALTFLTLRLEGRTCAVTGLRQGWRSTGSFATGLYTFAATADGVTVRGTFTTPPDRLVLARYRDPDGRPAFCANTEIGDLELEVVPGKGPPRRLRAEATAHFETGGRTEPAVARLHVTV